MEKSISSTKDLTGISFLSALGLLLMVMNTALPFFPVFLRIDLGDLPVLMGYRIYGVKAGIGVAFMKNFLHLFLSQTMGIGELMNFILSLVFILSLHFLLKLNFFPKKLGDTFSQAAVLSFTTVITALFALLANFFIMLPLYRIFLGITPEMILSLAQSFNPSINSLFTYFFILLLPFNLLKFGVLSILYYLIEKNVRSVM